MVSVHVEHDLDSAGLGSSGGGVEGHCDLISAEAEAVSNEGHDVHLPALHQLQAQGVLQVTSAMVVRAHRASPPGLKGGLRLSIILRCSALCHSALNSCELWSTAVHTATITEHGKSRRTDSDALVPTRLGFSGGGGHKSLMHSQALIASCSTRSVKDNVQPLHAFLC